MIFTVRTVRTRPRSTSTVDDRSCPCIFGPPWRTPSSFVYTTVGVEVQRVGGEDESSDPTKTTSPVRPVPVRNLVCLHLSSLPSNRLVRIFNLLPPTKSLTVRSQSPSTSVQGYGDDWSIHWNLCVGEIRSQRRRYFTLTFLRTKRSTKTREGSLPPLLSCTRDGKMTPK